MLRSVAVFSLVGALSLVANTAMAQPRGWTGFNVSVGGGVSKNNGGLDVATENNDRLDFIPIPQPSPISALFSIIGQANGSSSVGDDDWQGFGTLQGGYDQQFGNFVVGGFANFDFYPGDQQDSSTNGVDGSAAFVFLPPLFPLGSIPISDYATVTSSVELKNTWSIGGRLGYLVAERVDLRRGRVHSGTCRWPSGPVLPEPLHRAADAFPERVG